MSEPDRFERVEQRLNVLEREVRRLGGFAPTLSPAAPVAPSEPAPPPAAPVEWVSPPERRTPTGASLEALVAGRGLPIAGFVLVLIGAAFFLDLAFTRNWIGPAERIALGLCGGGGLVAFAAMRMTSAYRKLADALIGLGGGIMYLSLWSSVAVFPELGVSRAAAFAAMTAVTALLGGLAGLRRSQAVGLFALAGGFLTPALLASGSPDRAVLAAYLLVLCAGCLGMARRYRFAAVEIVTALGALAYSVAFVPSGAWSDVSAQIVVALFAVVFGVALTVGSAPAEPVLRRRTALLIVDGLAYLFALEMIFADRQMLLGINLLGFGAVLAAVSSIRSLPPLFARTYGWLGLAAVSLALPALVHGASLLDAFIVEGALLFAAGLRYDVKVAATGATVFALCGAWLLEVIGTSAPADYLSVDIAATLWLGSAALLSTRIRGYQKGDAGTYAALGRIGFDIVFVATLSRVCLDVFGGPSWNVAIPSGAQFGLSSLWTVYAATLFGFGLRGRRPLLRWEAMLLFASTILKVFSVDLSSVDLEYRIGSFVGLGIVLFAVSAWYTRSMAAPVPAPALPDEAA